MKKICLIIRRVFIFVCSILLILIIVLESVSSLYDYEHTSQECIRYTEPIKKAMVIVPHQDDEVFTAGGTIRMLVENNIETDVVFFTDGNSHDDIGKIRQKEAIESCLQLGCKEENVVCLQFPNRQQSDTTDASGVSSVELRDTMKVSLKKTIYEKKPDYIICTDFDFHRDHRTLSILFDEVIGEILSKGNTVPPIIHKGFAYQTSYNAVEDYYNINIKSTKKPQDCQNKLYDTDIPAYSWNNRIRIPLTADALTHSAFNNVLYKAFSEHKTQCVTRKAYSVLNGDNVFWERRTDNLIYKGIIRESSGNAKYLCDFKLYDTRNVTLTYKENVKFSDFLWMPNAIDTNPKISIIFDSIVSASCLRLFEDPDLAEQIKDVTIIVNDTLIIHSGELNNDGSPTLVDFCANIPIKSLELSNFVYTGLRPAIAELELLPSLKQKNRISINKIIEKTTGDFIYKYYVNENQKYIHLDCYSTDNCGAKMIISESKGNAKIENNVLILGEDFENCKVVLIDSNENICDEVEIEKINTFDEFIISISQSYDQMKLSMVYSFYKNRLVHSIIKRTLFSAIKRELCL